MSTSSLIRPSFQIRATCCIFRPDFSCCALQTLVKICLLNVFFVLKSFFPQRMSIITYFLAFFSAVCNHLRFSVSCLASYTVVGEQPYKSRDMVDSGLGRLLVNTIELTMHTSCYLGLGLTEKINCHRQNQIHNTFLCPRIVYIIEGHSCSSRRLYTLLHCSESSLRSQVQTE